jgi:hypothetical protein
MWVQYGLPLSALVAGSLTYALHRADPDHKRAAEQAAAAERIRAIRFAARRDVFISKPMRAIERNRAWVDTVNQLRANGYSDEQIAFIAQYTPELLMDKNANGRPDILDTPPTSLPSGLHNDNPRIVASETPVEQGDGALDWIRANLPIARREDGNGENPTSGRESGRR